MLEKKVRVLQFSQLINRYDFIDVIVRFADPARFTVIGCTFTHDSNIQKPEYAKDGFKHTSLNLPFNKYGFFMAIFRLARVLKREKIDIIHAHHYYEAFISRLALLFVSNCKLVITRHYHNELFLTTKGLKLKVYLWIERFVSRKSCIVISPSTQITDLLMDYGVPKSKISYIPYGFDFTSIKYQSVDFIEIESIRKQLGVENDGILIGNFARHHPIKGQELMLRSFADIIQDNKNVRLLMVGNGPIHSQLISLAKSLNIDSFVVFLGWQKDIRPYLSSVDIVWHPTLQEAFPQIMVESMALSKALCITPVSGASDVVENGVNGFIIPFNDPASWTRQILLLINDRDTMSRVGKNAHNSVTTSFAIQKIIGRIEAVYEECA
jgi:glycosyltransferase involved in cell wall biosynthesis